MSAVALMMPILRSTEHMKNSLRFIVSNVSIYTYTLWLKIYNDLFYCCLRLEHGNEPLVSLKGGVFLD
jgi:hypothetical protein